MRIAYVNCWTMPGGVLNVLTDLMITSLRKNGDNSKIQLFTLISDVKELKIPIPGKESQFYTVKITQALPNWINHIFLFCTKKKIKILSSIFDYRNLMVFYPSLMKILSHKIKQWKPDEIQISSFAIAKNMTPIPGVPTHLYLHSPMQYIRSHYEEYNKKLTGWKNKLFNYIVPKLRKRDLKYTKFDSVKCNSKYTQSLAKKLYGIESDVQYPKIKDDFRLAGISSSPMPYYVYVGRLVNFVRETGTIIKLFNKLQLPLIIIGAGPDEKYLKGIAGNSIIFTGWNPEGMIEIIRDSSGLINLTKESFGIGTVEALLMGVPVFGYSEGATAELVDENSGVLTPSKEIKELENKFRIFASNKRNRKLISEKIREKLFQK